MARRVRQRRAADEYRYFHLGHLETADKGKQTEQFLVENGIIADKSITLSGCFSFRWKKGDYDEKLLNKAHQVSQDPGMGYLQKEWTPIEVKQAKLPKNKEKGVNSEKSTQIDENTQKSPRKRRRRTNTAN